VTKGSGDGFRFFDFQVLVRDLDPQGHMANHVYVAYLSEARARFLRSLPEPLDALRPSVVAEVRLTYLSSLLPTEAFRVGVRVAKIGRTSIGFEYRMETQDRLIARGESVEVLVDASSRRPRQIEPDLRAVLGG
jgi:acyl-CoA thioester hydrolase